MLLFLSACLYDPVTPYGVRSGFQRTMTSFREQLPKKTGVNRFSDRRIWLQKARGLWIFAINRTLFERFRQASGLAKEEEESQINTLIYAMGDQADNIVNSFKLSITQLKQYHTVKKKFDEHFVVRCPGGTPL